jgi:hypothetical protein
MPFDTLKAARRLQEEGAFTQQQAETIAEILSDVDETTVTREYLDSRLGELRSEMESRFEEAASERKAGFEEAAADRRTGFEEAAADRQAIRTELQEVKTSIIRWVLISVGGLGAVMSIVAFLLSRGAG